MTRERIDSALESEFAEVARAAGCELLHAEFKGGVLRLVLDREGGIDLSHCETVSKQVSALLDLSDFGSGRYLLEVSSPGLDRQLYRPADYARFAGSRIRVTWKSADMPVKRTVVGRLDEYRSGPEESIVVTEPSGGESLELSMKDILVARLVPEL